MFDSLIKLILLTGFLLVPCNGICSGLQWITPQKAYALVKEGSGLWLVDVRGTSDFDEKHVEGAVHIPLDRLAGKHFPKGKIVVLIDDNLGQKRAREAAGILANRGMDKVFVLDGGISAWQRLGYPLTGNNIARGVRRVMPDELAWARKNRVPVTVVDLRDRKERASAVEGARAVEGKSLNERMAGLGRMLRDQEKKRIKGTSGKPGDLVIVCPTSAGGRQVAERYLSAYQGDIGYVEGGHAAWAVRPGMKTIVGSGRCPDCPEPKPQGGKR